MNTAVIVKSPYISVSYAPENEESVFRIAGLMESRGYRMRYSDEEHDDEECRVFLTFLSEEYVRTPECMSSFAAAMRSGSEIAVVYVGKSALPESLKAKIMKYHFTDARDYSGFDESLMERLCSIPGSEDCRIAVREERSSRFTSAENSGDIEVMRYSVRTGRFAAYSLKLCLDRLEECRDRKRNVLAAMYLYLAGALYRTMPSADPRVFGSGEALKAVYAKAEACIVEARSIYNDLLTRNGRYGGTMLGHKAKMFYLPSIAECQSELVRIYMLRHDYHSAERVLTDALATAAKLDKETFPRSAEAVMEVYLAAGEYYACRSRFSDAEVYLRKAGAVKLSGNEELSDRLRESREMLSAIGRIRSA